MNLRQAAQQALEALEQFRNISDFTPASAVHAITALRAALAEPEQEPYTWRKVTYDQLMEEVRNRGHEIRNAKITAPTPRKPLTDEEIEQLLGAIADTPRAQWLRQAAIEVVRKTEAAHGIGEQK